MPSSLNFSPFSVGKLCCLKEVLFPVLHERSFLALLVKHVALR